MFDVVVTASTVFGAGVAFGAGIGALGGYAVGVSFR